MRKRRHRTVDVLSGKQMFYMTQGKERMCKATDDSLIDGERWQRRVALKILPLNIPPLKDFTEPHSIFLSLLGLDYLFL